MIVDSRGVATRLRDATSSSCGARARSPANGAPSREPLEVGGIDVAGLVLPLARAPTSPTGSRARSARAAPRADRLARDHLRSDPRHACRGGRGRPRLTSPVSSTRPRSRRSTGNGAPRRERAGSSPRSGRCSGRADFTGKRSTPYAPGSVHDYMHAKVTVADDVAFVGSFNLSHSGELNAENVLEIADRRAERPARGLRGRRPRALPARAASLLIVCREARGEGEPAAQNLGESRGCSFLEGSCGNAADRRYSSICSPRARSGCGRRTSADRVATRSTRPSACSPSRTTTSRSPTRAPTRAAASTSTSRRCRRTSPATRSARTSGTATTASAPARRWSPRCPGSTRSRPSQNTGAVPHTDIERTSTRTSRSSYQRRHAPAPPDLVRARREPGQPGGHEPDHPARRVNCDEGGHYIVALRAAQGRERQHDQGAEAVPRLPRPRPARDSAVEARRPHMEQILMTLRQAGIGTQGPVSRLGLHGREQAQPERARALHPQPGLRGARRHQPRRPSGAGHGAAVPRSPARPTTRRAATTAARAARTTRSPARSTATSSCRAS